jgi:capsular exopolysaccharide synthesis family protein
MSKLFEIMNSGKGEIPDLVRPVVAVGNQPDQPAGTAGNGAPRSPATAAGPEETTPNKAVLMAEIRMLSLRVSANSPLLPFGQSQWRPSEQYRILRTKIVQHAKQPRLIVFSSPASGDGKTVSAINTAAALSLKSDAQVLLVDADFRKSALHAQLGLPESPGLAEVLKGGCPMEAALVRTQELPNLFVMTAGTPPDNPVELLDSEAWKVLSSRFRALFRYVVLDSPPVGAVADYELIQAVCDGVILVVRPDHTNRQLWQKSLVSMPKAKFLGVVLNCVPDWSFGRSAGADYYYYSGDKAYYTEQRGAGSQE